MRASLACSGRLARPDGFPLRVSSMRRHAPEGPGRSGAPRASSRARRQKARRRSELMRGDPASAVTVTICADRRRAEHTFPRMTAHVARPGGCGVAAIGADALRRCGQRRPARRVRARGTGRVRIGAVTAEESALRRLVATIAARSLSRSPTRPDARVLLGGLHPGPAQDLLVGRDRQVGPLSTPRAHARGRRAISPSARGSAGGRGRTCPSTSGRAPSASPAGTTSRRGRSPRRCSCRT